MLVFIVRREARAFLVAAVLLATVLLTTGAVLSAGAAVASTTPPSTAGSSSIMSPSSITGSSSITGPSAAQTCASYATAAGWANNGSLVTASAVCMAESGGQASIYYCHATGQDRDYPPVHCSGIYDRGLWQLDSAGQSGTTDACAFAAQCNADVAYRVSDRGTSFAPWGVYGSGVYTRYVGDAHAAVDALASGTVASGVLGVCLARGQSAVNAPVIVGECGTGASQQQWSALGGTVRSGQLCIGPTSTAAYAGVRLRWCDGLAWQEWAQSPTGQLRNVQTGGCLRDPGGSQVPGTQVSTAPCAAYPMRTWWLW
jgi:hypothetical protein